MLNIILFILEMTGATLIVKAGNGFMGEGGYEVDLLLMFISISLLLSGPGRVSIERDLLKTRDISKDFIQKKGFNSDSSKGVIME
jgi:putative oxidoreductase